MLRNRHASVPLCTLSTCNARKVLLRKIRQNKKISDRGGYVFPFSIPSRFLHLHKTIEKINLSWEPNPPAGVFDSTSEQKPNFGCSVRVTRNTECRIQPHQTSVARFTTVFELRRNVVICRVVKETRGKISFHTGAEKQRKHLTSCVIPALLRQKETSHQTVASATYNCVMNKDCAEETSGNSTFLFFEFWSSFKAYSHGYELSGRIAQY